MKYFIAVEIEMTSPMSDLSSALQRAFDNGASGNYRIVTTSAPSYFVIFERSASDDAEYVSPLAESLASSIENAAQQQLALELQSGDVGHLGEAIVDALTKGDATCFDFGYGAFEAMATWVPELALEPA